MAAAPDLFGGEESPGSMSSVVGNTHPLSEMAERISDAKADGPAEVPVAGELQ